MFFSESRAKVEKLGCGMAIVFKHRKSAVEVESAGFIGDIEGKTAIIVDDLTSTCGTLCNAASILKAKGAIEVIAFVSHLVLLGKGMENLENSDITELITTDSVYNQHEKSSKVTVLSIDNMVCLLFIRNLVEGASLYILHAKRRGQLIVTGDLLRTEYLRLLLKLENFIRVEFRINSTTSNHTFGYYNDACERPSCDSTYGARLFVVS